MFGSGIGSGVSSHVDADRVSELCLVGLKMKQTGLRLSRVAFEGSVPDSALVAGRFK